MSGEGPVRVTDPARNNAVECVESGCDAIGPVRSSISAARSAAEAEGWARGTGNLFRCPEHRVHKRRHTNRTDEPAPVYLRFPPQLVADLDAAAEERGLSRAALCRLLLADGLTRLIPVEELRLTRPPESPD